MKPDGSTRDEAASSAINRGIVTPLRWLAGSREGALALVIITLAVGLSVLEPRFLSVSNVRSLGTSMIYDIPPAAGMTLVLILGGIDLSVGSVLALTGVLISLGLTANLPVPLAIMTGLGSAAAVGALNGVLVARFGLPPFIVTLGTMSLARGLAVVLTSGYMVSGLPAGYLALGRGQLFGVPVPIVILAALLLGLHWLLRRWAPLYQAFYVGQNPEAARLAGLPVTKLTIGGYVASALLAGLSAIFMTSRLGMGYARFGELAELRAIAAAVLGGASLSGGQGSILGALLGVLLLSLILNGFVLLNLSIYWQSVATGLVLLLAVVVDRVRRDGEGEPA
jgi:ribose/xylose/arabinose/galactoside ABC-type transport system permease subunit